MTEVVIDKYR